MQVVMDKETPGIASIRGINLAAVGPTIIQLINYYFRMVAKVKA
jgi:hypothetical protein